jgi:aminoglycoside phosphotransferase (APT) family kinase protein
MDLIPADKRPAVARALSAAFGVSEFEDIRLLAGGLSAALVFRLVVRGTPYLLRIMMPWAGSVDPLRQFRILHAAAGAGLAPQIRYTHAEDRILITDFVTAQPFPRDMAAHLAPLLRRLHALPDFPRMQAQAASAGPTRYVDWVAGLVQRLGAAKLLPAELTAELFRQQAEVLRVYPHDAADFVACHNDLKPQNMVFDGTRLWLIDWEAAFLNDRHADLAMTANFFVPDDAAEAAYLAAYFGAPVDDERRARFFLIRQTMHLAYAAFLLPLAAKAGATITPDLDAPDFHEFHRRLVANEIEMKTAGERVQYAKVHLNAALRNLRSPRFAESLARVRRGADTHPDPTFSPARPAAAPGCGKPRAAAGAPGRRNRRRRRCRRR